MKRAVAKGAVQFAFGRFPGGSSLYRKLTRRLMGTQSSHVDKLSRVWPGYVKVWEQACGFDLEGKRIWIHEGGYTIFPFLVGYLATGRGPVVTNCEAELADQYVEKSVAAALNIELSDRPEVMERQERLVRLAEKKRSPMDWVELLESEYIENEATPASRCDIVHSGGVLEHYSVGNLKIFLQTIAKMLNPGGISSHIFDHRDHLYHADKQIPFLNHLKYSESTYRFLFGHKLCFHNRLSSGEIRELFAEAGFEEILVRRHILPDARYVDSAEEAMADGLLGLSRDRLHPQFQDKMSDADLHTAAAHYLFRAG